uniref:Uncharacterized protein n=1 Tax=Chromera velia CCMP2878 TaxID=1169474 RepID=A0A0G4HFL5_9ALVE|eukprot:Cvel_27085.t1-p1 / transcript=Cvel_27085.t1 / gene=Cvel_27085 / organism=Chromera_velia_CCMP2878 / gene_product=hypothetical protein / transcript_product=hypothetical protein / location=Cvel_scaffold3317:17368-17613(-) / protein_length=82 / sequence_SO=supercontig / SO=protein_coding / is_pseudo=false
MSTGELEKTVSTEKDVPSLTEDSGAGRTFPPRTGKDVLSGFTRSTATTVSPVLSSTAASGFFWPQNMTWKCLKGLVEEEVAL